MTLLRPRGHRRESLRWVWGVTERIVCFTFTASLWGLQKLCGLHVSWSWPSIKLLRTSKDVQATRSGGDTWEAGFQHRESIWHTLAQMESPWKKLKLEAPPSNIHPPPKFRIPPALVNPGVWGSCLTLNWDSSYTHWNNLMLTEAFSRKPSVGKGTVGET